MIQPNENAIDVRGLVVAYGRGAGRREAVRGLDFQVQRGETVGFIGPNGAGKSSTIKALMGFVFPQSGSVSLFGQPAGSLAARTHTGYLPEVSLYYPFMKAREILEFYGGLHGMDRRTLKRRIPELLECVGLGDRAEAPLKTFSKGMQQRVGIAQAIIADPDLLIFDELSSGLDPVGRCDLREVLLDLKRRGKTIFFSSHELHEVESLCGPCHRAQPGPQGRRRARRIPARPPRLRRHPRPIPRTALPRARALRGGHRGLIVTFPVPR